MRTIASMLLSVVLVWVQVAGAAEFRFSPRTNRAREIQWKPWSTGTLDEARRLRRPVLLSLSAVWCHWCHVMDETSYSDPDIIAFINRNYVAIRVDADRRPDVDGLYNQGGWPSTVILGPAGQVVAGGTYIPPEEMLPWLMKHASAGLTEQRNGAADVQQNRPSALARDAAFPSEEDIANVVAILLREHDDRMGGFGAFQKFPNPDAIDFLLDEYLRSGKQEVRRVIETTLTGMARGGINDKVEGGFFRYATRPDWSIPHYEKMLSVNAGLLRNYAVAFRVLGDEAYRRTMQMTLGYVMKNLYQAKSGLFSGSQDADENYYRAAQRKGRSAPFIDTTVYADANARMISALLTVYQATGETRQLTIARRAADRILDLLYLPKDGVYHYLLDGKRQVPGLLPDNVFVGLALLDLYAATGEERYLRVAGEIAGLVAGQFFDRQASSFLLNAGTTVVVPQEAGIIHRAQQQIIGCAAVILLSRVQHQEGSERYAALIRSALAGLSGNYMTRTASGALFGTALSWSVRSPVEITVVADGRRRDAYLAALQRVRIPMVVVRIYSLRKDPRRIRDAGYPVSEAMYACVGKTCSPPFTDTAKVKRELERFIGISKVKKDYNNK